MRMDTSTAMIEWQMNVVSLESKPRSAHFCSWIVLLHIRLSNSHSKTKPHILLTLFSHLQQQQKINRPCGNLPLEP